MNRVTFLIRLVFIQVLLALALFCSSSFAEPKPAKVLVIDSAVEESHPWIVSQYDKAAMEGLLHTVSGTPWILTWQQLNEQFFLAREAQIPADILSRLQEYYRAENLKSHGLLGRVPHSWGALKVLGEVQPLIQSDPKWVQGLRALVAQYHGTAVTGLIAQGRAPGEIELIFFPLTDLKILSFAKFEKVFALLRASLETANPQLASIFAKQFQGKVLPSEILRDALKQLLTSISDTYGQLSASIAQASVRVVNFSHATHLEMAMRYVEDLAGPKFSEQYRELLIRMATSIAEAEFRALQDMVRQNPNTVFVIAAGNDGKALNETAGAQFHTAQLNEKNAIVVGAIDSNGRLASYSNFGPQRVNVAATALPVKTAEPGGGVGMAPPGTSFAAPLVTRELSKIRYRYPELSAEAAIREFYAHHTVRVPRLAHQIQRGRALPLDPQIEAPWGRGVSARATSVSRNPDQACMEFWQSI